MELEQRHEEHGGLSGLWTSQDGAAGCGDGRCRDVEGGRRRKGNWGNHTEVMLTEVGVQGMGWGVVKQVRRSGGRGR